MNDIRVRIAPSPSGFLHIGTAKMALMNWLFARKSGGAFVLRLEDTDAERTDEEFVQAMCEGFQWLGIDWDEGPEFGGEPQKGDHGPYRQSQRRDLHRAEIQRLLDDGKAYKCFLSKDDLAALRDQCRAESRPLRSEQWRDATAEQIAAMGDQSYVVRFKVLDGETVVHDSVQGDVCVNHHEIDDFVIQKPNGDPIFHLAVVVDDGSMKISHVIRGDDHLTNAARHVLLFEALGYDLPQFSHLPMVLDERGKKYSKRDRGANVLDWREDGYLPEALINYVALLGWNPGDERELFSREELLEAFDVSRLGKSAAKFDLKKLQWLNGQHIRRLSPDELRDRLIPILEGAGLDTSAKSPEWLTEMATICQEKISTLNDIVTQTDFFFQEPTEYEAKAVKKRWKKDGVEEKMKAIREVMAQIETWTHDPIKAEFQRLADANESGLGPFVHPTRLALTGKSVGPGLFELVELLGKEACVARMDKGIEYVQNMEDE